MGEVDRAATAGQPMQGPRAGMGHHDGGAPEREPGVAVTDRAGDPEPAGEHLPDEVVDLTSAGRTYGAKRRAVIAPRATRAAPCSSSGSFDRFNAAFGIGSAGFSEGMVCVLPDRPVADPALSRIA